MSSTPGDDWLTANHAWLTKALDGLADCLRATDAASASRFATHEAALETFSQGMPSPPGIDVIADTFGLSRFERQVLLLCAGVELDAGLARCCADAQGGRPAPTFSFALSVLPEPHWGALSPHAPLRRWRLVEPDAGAALTTAPLRVDERVLHYLTGIDYLDPRIDALVEPVRPDDEPAAPYRRLAEQIAGYWSQIPDAAPYPIVVLTGVTRQERLSIAAAACASLGLHISRLDAGQVPADPVDAQALGRLWTREAALSGRALLIDCEEADLADTRSLSAVRRFLEAVAGATFLSSPKRSQALPSPGLALEVPALTRAEQLSLWQDALGKRASEINGQCHALVSQFDLGAGAIRGVAREALRRAHADGERLATDLWAGCRAEARPTLDHLVQVIEPRATWDDLVLPPARLATLREVAAQVRRRHQVYEEWGFAAKSARGLGISALFTGPSGTGKTLAAEVLAHTLQLDLYRIDLASVVSKYIGETEKNLARVFDAAEAGGAILLFDEADALFGKRSEIKDSHDRYANLEISYLLQRMELYAGLSILTTNIAKALDGAFQRRIRFVVQFPFPDPKQRAEIWRKTFPSATPTQGLDVDRLAQLDLAGGAIHNIGMNAAFHAADEDGPVRMQHILTAARGEYAKLAKPLTEAELKGWPV